MEDTLTASELTKKDLSKRQEGIWSKAVKEGLFYYLR